MKQNYTFRTSLRVQEHLTAQPPQNQPNKNSSPLDLDTMTLLATICATVL